MHSNLNQKDPDHEGGLNGEENAHWLGQLAPKVDVKWVSCHDVAVPLPGNNTTCIQLFDVLQFGVLAIDIPGMATSSETRSHKSISCKNVL